METDLGVWQHRICWATETVCAQKSDFLCSCCKPRAVFLPRKVCTPWREHIWDCCSLLPKAAQESTKQHCWCHFTPGAFTKAGGRAGRELEVKGQLSSMHHTASLQILPAQPEELLQRGRAQTNPPLWLKMEKSLILCNCVSSHLYFCHWLTGWEEGRRRWVGRHQREENYHQIRQLEWEGREKE